MEIHLEGVYAAGVKPDGKPCSAEGTKAGEQPLRCPGPHQLMATSPPEPLSLTPTHTQLPPTPS